MRDRKSKWTYSVPICARLDEQDRRRPVPALKRQMQRRVACVGRDRKSGQCLAREENRYDSPSWCRLKTNTGSQIERGGGGWKEKRTHPILGIQPRPLPILPSRQEQAHKSVRTRRRCPMERQLGRLVFSVHVCALLDQAAANLDVRL